MSQRRNRAYLNPLKDRDRGPRPDLRLISGARSTDAADLKTLAVRLCATTTLTRRGEEERATLFQRLVLVRLALPGTHLQSTTELCALTIELSDAAAVAWAWHFIKNAFAAARC